MELRELLQQVERERESNSSNVGDSGKPPELTPMPEVKKATLDKTLENGGGASADESPATLKLEAVSLKVRSVPPVQSVPRLPMGCRLK
jgi:hypothetical protein